MPIFAIWMIGAFFVGLVGLLGEFLFIDSIVSSEFGRKGYWLTLVIIYGVISVPPAMLMNHPTRLLAVESFVSEAMMSVIKVMQWISVGYLIGLGIYLQGSL